jgi:hypothetical protein
MGTLINEAAQVLEYGMISIVGVPINHESVRKNLFENCGWCKLHRPVDCPKRTVPSPVGMQKLE